MEKRAYRSVLAISHLAAALAFGQSGQERPRDAASWPCVAGRAVDPAYIETSERSGGQVLLFDRSEVARSADVLIAREQHPQTIFRAAGELNGEPRRFEFPVDSTVESLLVTAFVQCKSDITLRGPRDVEPPGAEAHDYRAGRLVEVTAPQPGNWNVTIAGKGVFSILVQAKAGIELEGVTLIGRAVEAQISGVAHDVAFRLISRVGDMIEPLSLDTMPEEGRYRGAVTPTLPAFRIAVRGVDDGGWPFQRVHAPLLATSAKAADDKPGGGQGAPVRE